jgi:hypothetical protein
MRAHLIGNGPSLKDVDLLSLSGGLTFACNRIHLHPSWEGGWRPDYYVVSDISFNPSFAKDLKYHLSQDYPVIATTEHLMEAMLFSNPKTWVAESPDHIREWWTYPHLRGFPRCFHGPEFLPSAWHPPVLCAFGGPVHIASQIAVLELGCDELVLHGCDGDFVEDTQANNFTPDYLWPTRLPPWYVELRNMTVTTSLGIIQDESAKRGVVVVQG